MEQDPQIFAGFHAQGAIIKMTGRATWKTALALKRLTLKDEAALLKGRLLFDLTECSHLDSTLIGLVSQIAVAHLKATGHKATARIGSDRLWAVFELMNCDRLMNMAPPVEGDPPFPTELIALPAVEEEQEELRDVMLGAHTTLSALNVSNEEEFSDVVEDLKRFPQLHRPKGEV